MVVEQEGPHTFSCVIHSINKIMRSSPSLLLSALAANAGVFVSKALILDLITRVMLSTAGAKDFL